MTRHRFRFVRPPSPIPSTGVRAGMALLELMCAAALLSAMMLVLLPLLTRVSQVRSHLQARESVVRELGNIVEQVRAGGRPSQDAFETVGARVVTERLAPALDDARFSARIEDGTGEEATSGRLDQQQRIVLTIAWTGEQGIPQSISLACWVLVEQAAAAGEVP